MSKSKCLIVSAMRDEGPYILEWIAFHRAIGISDFLIYTNDCRDGTDLLLDRLAYNGVVTHVRNKVLKRGPQKSAFKAAMAHPAYSAADWVLASDVDEFLNIKIGAGHIDDLIKRTPDADAIPVCWRMFSNNDHEALIPGFSIAALTDAETAEPDPNAVGRFVKSLFKPRADVVRIGTHAPVYTDEFETTATWGAPWIATDDPRRPKTNYGYDIAQMNHYAVRAIDPFLLKRDRGDANFMANRLELDYWSRWCRGGTEDTSILRHLPAMEAALAALTKDPIVRHLHEGAHAFHQNRISELLQTPEYRDLKTKIQAMSGAPQTAVPDAPKQTPNPAAEELALKAPGRHQNRLRMLEQLPKHGRGAEIGVWNGGFSEYILEVTEPKELVLIDPWDLLSQQSEDEQTHKKHADTDFMGDMFANVTSRYGHLDNVKITKGFSAEVLATYPDDYFDWVYVDGNHQYDFVKKDVEIAFQKVKAGGIVAGDDFFWKRNDRMHVKEAVLNTMRNYGMQNRPTRFGQQFMITVPDKPLTFKETT